MRLLCPGAFDGDRCRASRARSTNAGKASIIGWSEQNCWKS